MKRMVWIAVVAWLVPGCIGPGAYIATTAFNARRVVAEAEAAGAKSLAPYEYWSATIYLEMSRQKAAQADYQDAWKYGKQAIKMAQQAKRLVSQKGQAPSVRRGGGAAADQPTGPHGGSTVNSDVGNQQ